MTQCAKGRAVLFFQTLKVQSGSLGKWLVLGRAWEPQSTPVPPVIWFAPCGSCEAERSPWRTTTQDAAS